MFLKLWKYEIKCSYRTYLLLYAILLLLPFFMNVNMQILSTLSVILYSVMIIITLVMTFVLIIRNYNQSMFSRAGYLTMTLPVSSNKILLVKILNATLWFILSYIVIALSVILITTRIGEISFGDLFEIFGQVFRNVTFETWVYLLEFTVGMLQMVTMIYMILNITHTNYIRKHRGIIGIAIFIVLEIILSYVNGLLYTNGGASIFTFLFSANTATLNYSSNTLYITLLEDLVLLVLFYFGASYLLDHKLELE